MGFLYGTQEATIITMSHDHNNMHSYFCCKAMPESMTDIPLSHPDRRKVEVYSVYSAAVLHLIVLVQVLRHFQPALAVDFVLGYCESCMTESKHVNLIINTAGP